MDRASNWTVVCLGLSGLWSGVGVYALAGNVMAAIGLGAAVMFALLSIAWAMRATP